MKTHPNKKRVLRKIANVMRWHYFGQDLSWENLSPAELRFENRLIFSYIREDANGRYF